MLVLFAFPVLKFTLKTFSILKPPAKKVRIQKV